jgi:hypothetical protein
MTNMLSLAAVQALKSLWTGTTKRVRHLKPGPITARSNTQYVYIKGPDGWRIERISGRALWALKVLHRAGARGIIPMKNPAPRWSGYVWELRQLGIDIETLREPHGGEFPGWHGKYVLISEVRFPRVVP